MSLRRFLPDLVLLTFALAMCLWWWSHRQGAKKRLAGAGALLIGGGLLATLLQAMHLQIGYRLLLLSGLGFVAAACLVWAAGIWLASRRVPMNPARRDLLTATVMAAPAAVLGFGILSGRRQFRLEEVDLAFPNLPSDLDGLRLAQLSDIHLSPFLSRTDLAWCVDLANETRPHVAFVTGDLITGIYDSIDDCVEELKRLRADAGVFGCMGNHESYIGAEAYIASVAGRRGLNFLRQQQQTLTFGGARLNIAGVDHQWRRDNYLRGAEKLIRPGEWNLLMSHHPDVFPRAARQGWDLTLSGHMHGGQINLELASANLNFVRFVTPYVAGVYRREKSAIYVSRGIGTVGMPARVGSPPEVTLIRLRRV